MKYEPLTPEKFADKLKTGEYESLTGARRAVGKASWNDAQRDKARKQADAHFGAVTGVLTSPFKKPAAKKVTISTIKQKLGSVPTAAPKPRGRKPRAAQMQSSTETAAPSVDMTPGHFASATPAVSKPLTVADIRKNPFQTIQLAEHAVQSGTSVLNALTEAKKQHPSLETSAAHDQAIDTIRSALKLTSTVIDKLSEGMSVPDAIKEVVSVRPVNGATFEESVTPGHTGYEAPVSRSMA